MRCEAVEIPMPITSKNIHTRKSHLAIFAHKCYEVRKPETLFTDAFYHQYEYSRMSNGSKKAIVKVA